MPFATAIEGRLVGRNNIQNSTHPLVEVLVTEDKQLHGDTAVRVMTLTRLPDIHLLQDTRVPNIRIQKHQSQNTYTPFPQRSHRVHPRLSLCAIGAANLIPKVTVELILL